MGVAGHDHEMTDYSPDGHAARAEAARSTLASLDALTPADETDVLTLAAMRDRLGLELELDAAGELLNDLNNIASPLQGMRDVFDLMPTAHHGRLGGRRGPPGRAARVRDRLRRVAATGGLARSGRRAPAGRGGRPAGRGAGRHRRRRSSPGTRRCADGVAGRAAHASCEAAACGRPRGVRRPGARAARGAGAEGPAGRRRRPRTLRAVLPRLPRRDRRPRRDVRLGPGGARPHGRRADGRRRAARRPGCHASRRPSPRSTPTRRARCTAPRRCRRGCRRRPTRRSPRSTASHFDIPDPMRTARVPDRPDAERRHLLHRPDRRLLPPGSHVVVGAAGASPSSTPGARRRPSTTRAFRAITCRSARRVFDARARSTAGAGWPAGRPGTARAGRCTPSG